jgi:hypothetical protein
MTEYHEHYRVIKMQNLDMLMNKASNMIGDGWMPAGGIAHHGQLYMQAMWRPPMPDEVKIIMQTASDMEAVTK